MEKMIVEIDGGGIVKTPIPKPSFGMFGSKFTTKMYGGDFYNLLKTSNGQQLIEFSEDPFCLVHEQSYIMSKDSFKFPGKCVVGMSVSNKGTGGYFVVEATDGTDMTPDVEYNITALSQTTTVMTVTIDAEYSGYIGDWVDIYGLVDNRFNVANACVASISLDRKSLQFNTTDDVTIVSLTATCSNLTGGKLKKQSKLFSNANGLGIRTSGGSGNSACLVKYDNGDYKVSGTTNGAQLLSNISYSPVYSSSGLNSNGYEIKPTGRFCLQLEDVATMDDAGTDSGGAFTNRFYSTEVKPDINVPYYFRARGFSSKSNSKPINTIKSISKSGTTTAKIVCDASHGLTAGSSVIGIQGVRNQTDFPNSTALTVVSVSTTNVFEDTFTVTFGTSVTATSYGGYINIVNGQRPMIGMCGGSIQTITSSSTTGLITLINTVSWSGFGGIGELVNLYGCNGSIGNSLNVDGVYRIINNNTTSLTLEPIRDNSGVYVKNGFGQNVTPPAVDLNAVSCGGNIILRTTLRISDLDIQTWQTNRVKMVNEGYTDDRRAIPTRITSFNAAVGQGAGATVSGTTGLGGWYMHPAIVGLTDISSAAITTTTTSTAITNALGNGFQVVFSISIFTGTYLDISIEESFDGGTSYVKLYDFERIIGTGVFFTPILRATGRHIRYVRTFSGTTTTMVAVRNVLPFIPAEPQKRIIDRSIVLTTQDSVTPVLFQGAANNIQLVLNLGVTTTPPIIQLEGSEDKINFYPIGTTLTGISGKTVEITIHSRSTTFVRAKCVYPGVSVTMGYVVIKAYS